MAVDECRWRPVVDVGHHILGWTVDNSDWSDISAARVVPNLVSDVAAKS